MVTAYPRIQHKLSRANTGASKHVTFRSQPDILNPPSSSSVQASMRGHHHYADEVSRSYYGTDVPTLQVEMEGLRRKLRRKDDELARKEQELRKVKADYRKLSSDYSFVWREMEKWKGKYEDAKRKLKSVGWR